MWNELTTWQRVLMIVLAVLGIVLVVVAIIYFAEPAKSLPSFFPDHSKHSKRHATHHAELALGLGVVLLVLAGLTPIIARRRRVE